jgi:glycosyl transferase family 1
VVAFDGWLPRDQVGRAMARAAAFVHPSPSETFGVVAAEAILTGLPVAARRSGGVPWIIELSGGYGRVADGDGADAFGRAIEAVLDGGLAVDAAVARSRLIEAIGERAVGRQARELYERAITKDMPEHSIPALSVARRAELPGGTAGSPYPTHPSSSLPGLLVATGRDQALRLVAELPVRLQQRMTLVVPARTADAADAASAAEDRLVVRAPALHVVDADPVPPPTRRPHGRGPLTRLRGALWHPAPTGPELLARAVIAAAGRSSTGRAPVEIVAIDAPAAALVAGLDAQRVRLAPGGLRWLADRWDAEALADR